MLTSKAKLSANVATKFGLAMTVAALWMAAVPFTAAAAAGPPRLSNQRGPRSGPAGVQPLRGRLELCIPGLYGPTWPSGIVGKVRHRIDRKPFVGAMTGPWRRGIASPPCNAIRPRRHLPLRRLRCGPPYQATNRSDRSASLSLRFSASS